MPDRLGQLSTTTDTLVEEFRKGDSAALQKLIDRDGRWVAGAVYAVLGNSDLVDDVVQEVWLTAWRRVGDLQDSRKWRSWIFRLARNAAIDVIRRSKNRVKLLQRFSELIVRRKSAVAPAEVSLAHDEEHRRILKEIEDLPEIYREAFVLRHLEGWTYREIADAMSIPTDTVETRLVRARRILRDKLSRRKS